MEQARLLLWWAGMDQEPNYRALSLRPSTAPALSMPLSFREYPKADIHAAARLCGVGVRNPGVTCVHDHDHGAVVGDLVPARRIPCLRLCAVATRAA